MKTFRVWMFLVVVLSCMDRAYAVEGTQVALHGGTVSVVPSGTIGVLDLTGQEAMVFKADGKQISVPYAGLKSVEATSELARHLGVVPAIGAGLVRKRECRHYITLTYEDADHGKQAVIFEVAKGRPAEILLVIKARAPGACGSAQNACRQEMER